MSIEAAVWGLLTVFFVLTILAVSNWRDLSKDRGSVTGKARYFVEREMVRVRLRALGWAMFSAAMSVRLFMPDGPNRGLTILGVALVAGIAFVVEAIVGRLERRRMLRGADETDQELEDK